MLSLTVFFKPLAGLGAVCAVAVHPEIGVWVDDFAIGDGENFGDGDLEEGEVGEFGVIFEEIVGVATGEDGSAFESGESGEGGLSVAFWVFPLDLPVEVVVGEESFPE